MQASPTTKRALKNPRFWAWLALAAWPPALLGSLAGWDLMDPRTLGALLLWWPMDALGRLGALSLLLSAPGQRTPAQALAPALAAELLLGLKASALALLGLVPAIALLSLDQAAFRPAALLLAILGLVPAVYYALKRLLAPLWLLRSPLNATQALDASAAQTSGRFKLFLRLALPWVAVSLGLELLSLGVPDAAALLLAPLGLACGLLALARADAGLA